MKAKVSFILTFCLMFVTLSSCFKSEEYPIEPIIADPSFVVYSDSAVLSFNFTDGDGDIGLSSDNTDFPFDSGSYYYYNLYIDYYEKDDINGWQRGLDLAGDSISFAYRMKPILVSGKQRGIKGKMDVTMRDYKNPFSNQSDTVKFTVQLIDRALNKSNVIETTEITD